MRTVLGILLLIVGPSISFGQLTTFTGISPNTLVQNTLAGPGVTITNVTFNGSSTSNDALGRFTASGNLGMTEGLIMTTGTIQNTAAGPHGPNNLPSAGVDNGTGGYGLLTSLIGVETHNAAVLEFDFSTCSDSVSFEYVFGSEEYLEYVNTEFNDVFGFFISGPGISGQQNIARLPNNQVVSINNVHSAGVNINGQSFGAVNGQYYVNNAGGTTVEYDGFTTVLKAKAAVQCFQTYHMILAVADAGDGIYDSGIFLRANSFTANSPFKATSVLSDQFFSNPLIMAEGCVSGTITLDRVLCGSNLPLTVPISVSGSATEGVDFSNIPASVTFPANSTSVQFSFDALSDLLIEGQENIILSFTVTDNCGNVSVISYELFIDELPPLEATIVGGVVDCPGEPVTITVNSNGGAQPYSYLWDTGDTTQSITVSPSSTQTYSVVVSESCSNPPITLSFVVDVPVIDPLEITTSPDITEICPYIPHTLEALVNGGTSPYFYQWSTSSNPNIGAGNTVTVTPSSSTTYYIEVTDACGLIANEEIQYTITSPPLVLEMSPAVEICPGDSVFISVTATGGYGDYFYNWYHSGETTPGVWVYPEVTSNYTVNVSDECQTFYVEGTTTVKVVKPTADFTTTSTVFFNGLPITFMNLSQNAVFFEWDFGDGNSSTVVNPSNTYLEPGLYYITLVAIDEKGCTDTITKPIGIEEEWYIYVPNTFTPDEDRHNTTFRAVTVGIRELTVIIFNRWGEEVFTSDELDFAWDGTYRNAYVPDGTYTYKIEFLTNSGRNKTIHGHVNVIK